MTLTFPAAYGKIPLISQPSPAERPDHEKNVRGDVSLNQGGNNALIVVDGVRG